MSVAVDIAEANDVGVQTVLRKAGATRSEMLFLTQSLKTLFSDENFVTLLRAEGLSSIPKTIADRLTRINGART